VKTPAGRSGPIIYPERVRPSSLAAICIVAAVLGGAAALVTGRAAGWLGSSTTVVSAAGPADAGLPAPVVAARPIVGHSFDPAQIYRLRSAGVVTIVAYFKGSAASGPKGGQGSGFVVSPDGTILTSAHVVTTAGSTGGAVGAAQQIYVEFSDGDRVTARLVGYDLFDDVGVIRVDPHDHVLDPVPLGDSGRVVVGQPVAAIGSPFAQTDSLSVGVVSAVQRPLPSLTSRYDLVDAIQIDAPINHGNSGGPLFDARGRVIGINAQIRSSGTSSGFEGVGFAVPINSARRSLGQLLQNGRVAYAYVGIRTDNLTPSIAERFGYAARQGALVDVVNPGPGRDAGLRAGTRDVIFEGDSVRVGGDAIVAIAGIPVRNAEDVVRIVTERCVPGQVVRVVVVNGKHRRTVRVKLTERPS
jgi:2-alkenal reductase